MEIVAQLFYDGRWHTGESNTFSPILNPATEEVVAKVIQATANEVDQAVIAAKKAFPKWQALKPRERQAYFLRLKEALIKYQEELAQTIQLELGSAFEFTRSVQVGGPIRELTSLLEEFTSYNFEETRENATIVKEGFGVVACITPWNYPLSQIQRKVAPALLAGNTVVVKPATNTPLTAILYAKIIEEVGFPPGVFNLITGNGSEIGAYLANHPEVAVISFTGSTKVGKSLYALASTNVKKLILELGGKSALIYLKGGDLAKAVELAAKTVIDNQGQTCSALSRLLIPKTELVKTKELLIDYYQQLEIGDPQIVENRVGPLVSKTQEATVLNYIAQGEKEGAQRFIGGHKLPRKGYFIEPTVFLDVTNQMTIAQEEIFGPVLAVLTYETVEEAIALANDSIYGLSGAVVGPKEEAMQVARQLRTGNVSINGAPRSFKAPFGGYKQSGLGCEIGLYGLEDYLEIKAIFR